MFTLGSPAFEDGGAIPDPIVSFVIHDAEIIMRIQKVPKQLGPDHGVISLQI